MVNERIYPQNNVAFNMTYRIKNRSIDNQQHLEFWVDKPTSLRHSSDSSSHSKLKISLPHQMDVCSQSN